MEQNVLVFFPIKMQPLIIFRKKAGARWSWTIMLVCALH